MRSLERLSVQLAIALLLVATRSEGFGKRVDQIPNGAVFGCANCHVDPSGGGPRNPFGQEIEANFLTADGFAGDVIWGPELAALDSDGDGAPNGFELQDTAGTWVVGTADPGTAGAVSNPGDGGSTPSVALHSATWTRIKSLFIAR